MNGKWPPGTEMSSRASGFLKRLLIQTVRLALIALFLYITYLGFMWRKVPKPSPAPPPAPVPSAATSSR